MVTRASISCWGGYLDVEIFDGGVVLFLEGCLFLAVVPAYIKGVVKRTLYHNSKNIPPLVCAVHYS